MAWLVTETQEYFCSDSVHQEDTESYSGKWPAASGMLVKSCRRPVLTISQFAVPFSPNLRRCPCPPRLTKNRSGRDGLPVKPEGDLGQDDRHYTRQVGLDHEVPDLPLEVEVCGHDDILPCRDRRLRC